MISTNAVGFRTAVFLPSKRRKYPDRQSADFFTPPLEGIAKYESYWRLVSDGVIAHAHPHVPISSHGSRSNPPGTGGSLDQRLWHHASHPLRRRAAIEGADGPSRGRGRHFDGHVELCPHPDCRIRAGVRLRPTGHWNK